MLQHIRHQLHKAVTESLSLYPELSGPQPFVVDFQNERSYGEFSCNVALQLARPLKKNPAQIADELAARLRSNLPHHGLAEWIGAIEVKKPGFINFFLSPKGFHGVLEEVFKKNDQYGRSDFGNKQKVQVEFVSANPTGPLTVAHGRQAAVGDTLVNILNAVGYDAAKEYYVNDEGNQINILGRSIHCRAQQLLGEKIEFLEDGYQGEYIREMAREFLAEKKIAALDKLAKVDAAEFRAFGVAHLMAMIKKDLADFNVHFDIWSYQSKIADAANIVKVLEFLKAKGHLYEHEGALWFKSTAFGDDKDRVVKKSDGSYTYLTPDIVYHKDKFERGFEKIFNIWGPDHHGYIPRIKAAAGALGYDPEAVEVLIVQLATIYRAGKPVSMSTRRGEFISLREVIDEVGADAGRFFFLMRQISAHLDFDLELAKKESPENPVYYIQYAHARIHSVIRKAEQDNHLKPKSSGWTLLKEDEEIELIRKVGFFPETLVVCAKQRDPFALIRYLQELAGTLHKFYDKHRVLDEDQALAAERLGLIEAVRIVLANGLRLVGVRAPERM